MKEDYCDFCRGIGKHFSDQPCVYCNGTGEWNQAAQSYVKNHQCQCLFLDRKFCPICHQICHHDTSLNPKQKIDPGHGGVGTIRSTPHEEEEIGHENQLLEVF